MATTPATNQTSHGIPLMALLLSVPLRRGGLTGVRCSAALREGNPPYPPFSGALRTRPGGSTGLGPTCLTCGLVWSGTGSEPGVTTGTRGNHRACRENIRGRGTTGVHIWVDSCLHDLSRGTPEVVRFVSCLSAPVTVLAVLLGRRSAR